METLFLYLGKVILTSGVMFCYYRLFLKDRTFHHYNRFYLLAVLLISLLLPLLKVNYFTLEVNSGIYLLLNKLQYFNEPKTSGHDFIYFKFVTVAVGLVTFIFLSRLIYGIIKIQQLKRKYLKEQFEDINFYHTNLPEAPFSFFRNLFWKDSIPVQSDLGRQILNHEMVHIEQKHSWDKIIIEILTAVFWFNPFFYLIRKEINLIHEYLADKKAIKNSDTKAFAQMLLASQFSGKHLPAASPFLSSNLKKRITMLTKSKTKFSYARRLFALPILFVLAFAYLVNAKNREIAETNLEIERYIAATQTDTIIAKPAAPPEAPPAPPVPPIPPAVEKELQLKEKQLKPLNDAIIKQSDEARKISAEMSLKNVELEKLVRNKDFDSPKFKKLEKEMSQLSEKMENIFNADDFKMNMKKLELEHAEMDKLYAQVDSFYNSEDFKLKIKEADAKAKAADQMFNSPEFKKRIKDAEKKAKEVEKRMNTPEFRKKMKEAEKKFNSPEFQQRIKDAENAATEAAKNAAGVNLLRNNSEGAPKVFIDGKAVTKEEIDQLSPDRIEKMEVFKKGFNENKTGEIHITTKK